MAIAAKSNSPFAILMGTTTGMLIAEGIGIIIGVVLNKKIPEKIMKWMSAAVFALFGILGYVESVKGMDIVLVILSITVIVLISSTIAFFIVKPGNE